MNTRRGFLWALGMGGASLGLAGKVQAFGRRRRCVPIRAECPAPDSAESGSHQNYFRPVCTTVCPQSMYASINGVYYYLGICCRDQSQVNVSSYMFINCPQNCSDTTNCINTLGSAIMVREGARANSTLPDPDSLLLSTGLRCEGVSFLDEPKSLAAKLVKGQNVTQTADLTVQYTDDETKTRYAHLYEMTLTDAVTGKVQGVVRFGHELRGRPDSLGATLPAKAVRPNDFHHLVKSDTKFFNVHLRVNHR